MHPSRRKPLAACVAAVFALSAPVAVNAATYFVTTCDDSGALAGTLRLAANNAVSGDIIDMTGLSASSPSCSGAINGFAAFMTVNSTVSVAGGVTINGPGKSAFAVSGLVASGTGPVFTSTGDLTFNNVGVKYRNRYVAGSAVLGGCIHTGGNLTLTNVKALNCSASSGTNLGRGGAAYAVGAQTATGSDFINTYAYSKSGLAGGGGVFGAGSVTLSNSTVTCNAYSSGTCTTTHATSNTGAAYGGALDTFGSVKVTGGGIYGQALVTGTSGGHAEGGAIFATTTAFVYGADVSGTASTQSGASAKGGAIFAGTIAYLGQNSIISGSNAYSKSGSSYGGGIFTSAGECQVKYSVVNDSSAKRGGGVYSQGGVWAKYSQFFNDYAQNGGGAIINTSANTLIQGTSILDNFGQGWNAVDHIAKGTTTVTIENSTISGNLSTGSAPAVLAEAYRTVIDNSTIVYNTTGGTAAADAGVRVSPGNAGSTLALNSTLISSNANASGNDDLFVDGGASGVTFTATSGHNLVRNPGGGVPGDTIVGKCPQLHPLSFGGAGWIFVYRPAIKSPAVDAGSNPLGLTADQRGDDSKATFPPRASGPGPNNASPIPDIGAYEVDQDDIIFDAEFETCT